MESSFAFTAEYARAMPSLFDAVDDLFDGVGTFLRTREQVLFGVFDRRSFGARRDKRCGGADKHATRLERRWRTLLTRNLTRTRVLEDLLHRTGVMIQAFGSATIRGPCRIMWVCYARSVC